MKISAGETVFCTYSKGWWGAHVGTVVAPGTDPALWNGLNSEAHYCEVTGKLPVQYDWGLMHDTVANLIPCYLCPACGAINVDAWEDEDLAHGVYHMPGASCFDYQCGKCQTYFCNADSPIMAEVYTHIPQR